mgnify:CR=1 FL=1
MEIVAAIDSFKGSMTSVQAGKAAAKGIHKVDPEAKVHVRPLADGGEGRVPRRRVRLGEGTVEALVSGMNGTIRKVSVTGPIGKTVVCEYGVIENTGGKTEEKTAVIEIAKAAGLTLLSEEERNPLYTTTYGVGEVIKDAVRNGCRKFIVGIGGSATNDGGAGMLQALGFGLLKENGEQIPIGARGLEELAEITDDNVIPELAECKFKIACDVTNVLCGETGASAVYGPQKGADEEMTERLDRLLFSYASLVKKKIPKADSMYPGTGAAGGLGFAFLTFMDAQLESGIQIVIKETGLEQEIAKADLVITGEGRMDGQTAMGKAPIGIAKIAKKYGKPVIAFAGAAARDAGACNEQGIDAFFPILREAVSLEAAMKRENAEANMEAAVEQAYRLCRL